MARRKMLVGPGATPKRPAVPLKPVRMKADARFEYADVMRDVGDEFDAEPQHVHLLTVIGHASVVPAAGTYRRRDLVADDPS